MQKGNKINYKKFHSTKLQIQTHTYAIFMVLLSLREWTSNEQSVAVDHSNFPLQWLEFIVAVEKKSH